MRLTFTGFAFFGVLFGFVFFVVMTFGSMFFGRVRAFMRCLVAIFMKFLVLDLRFIFFLFVFFLVFFDVKVRAASQCIGLCARLGLFVFRFHQPCRQGAEFLFA